MTTIKTFAELQNAINKTEATKETPPAKQRRAAVKRDRIVKHLSQRITVATDDRGSSVTYRYAIGVSSTCRIFVTVRNLGGDIVFHSIQREKNAVYWSNSLLFNYAHKLFEQYRFETIEREHAPVMKRGSHNAGRWGSHFDNYYNLETFGG
jgi:hypothetical protein